MQLRSRPDLSLRRPLAGFQSSISSLLNQHLRQKDVIQRPKPLFASALNSFRCFELLEHLLPSLEIDDKRLQEPWLAITLSILRGWTEIFTQQLTTRTNYAVQRHSLRDPAGAGPCNDLVAGKGVKGECCSDQAYALASVSHDTRTTRTVCDLNSPHFNSFHLI